MNKDNLKIYSVLKYNRDLLIENIEKKSTKKAECFESNDINKIIEELKNDKGYHLNLNKNSIYKFNIDIDGMKKKDFEEFKKILKEEFLEITKKEIFISYTINKNGKKNIEENTDNYIYSHITIKNICASSYIQKNFWNYLKKKYSHLSYGLDAGHLGILNKWFRMPNQKKEQKEGTEHKIIEGIMRDFILDDIEKCENINKLLENIEKDKKEEKVKIIKIVKENNKYEKEKKIFINNSNENSLINLLSLSRFDNWKEWSTLLWIFKSLFNNGYKSYNLETFIKLSKTSSKFKSNEDCIDKWEKTTINKTLNEGIIKHYCKLDNIEEYEKLTKKQEITGGIIVPFLEIKKKYLIEDKDLKIINDKSDILQKSIINFFEDENIKGFNLKSPYNTGKTQLIKRILNTFNPIKVLWLSYRKTLTNDILFNFENEYNFMDYQKNLCNADRLVIQLESIYKIPIINNEVPSYDLVIIDEVESILNHFNSSTFKGESKTSFNFMHAILKNSKKIITMDGDLGERTYKFMESLGNCINIVNNIQIDKKNFFISHNKETYYLKIKEDLEKNLKIIIVSMSSEECNNFENKILEDFKDKKILKYTGSCDDELKKDFKNVGEVWVNADVLIYSPTCESGVNFDIMYFNKMYGILSKKSTSPRAFFQMLGRVRKIDCNDINILNEHFMEKYISKVFFKFDEVKQSIFLLENYKLDITFYEKDGKMYINDDLKPYDINYIYNRTEDFNKKNNFLGMFKYIAEKKGHSVNFIEDKKIKEDNKKTLKERLLEAEDIETEEDFILLMKKQEREEATEEDKIMIRKHILKYKLGVDKLGVDILSELLLNKFNEDSIDNFIGLIDINNIKKGDEIELQTTEKINKSLSIKRLINDLSFKNIFDDKNINSNDFENIKNKILTENELFSNEENLKNTRIRFNIDKKIKINDEKTENKLLSIKGFLGLINSLLKEYSINIEYGRKKIKGKKEAIYKIDLGNINELLEYRILKGLKLKDEENIRIKNDTEVFKDLVDFEKIENKKLKIDLFKE